jgi:hypothetical protein
VPTAQSNSGIRGVADESTVRVPALGWDSRMPADPAGGGVRVRRLSTTV